MHEIDQVRLAFSPNSFIALNLALALIMFGVALDLKVEDFRRALRQPRGPAVGLLAQFIVLRNVRTVRL